MMIRRILFNPITVAMAAICALAGTEGSSGGRPDRRAAAGPVFGKAPLLFIPNEGQEAPAVAFCAKGLDKTIYFSSEGLTITFPMDPDPLLGQDAPSRWAVKLDFVEADRDIEPVGLERSGTTVSFFRDERAAWITGLEACSRIAYQDLWPGIDLVYSGTFDRMKYELVVKPGADASKIGFICRGADAVSLTADGRLSVRTPAGGFEDDTPVAYQEADGRRRDVPVAFTLDGTTFGFKVGAYDRERPLVIDPSSFVYLGYLGGSRDDTGRAIVVDGEGCAYIAGTTLSDEASFPVTVGPDLGLHGRGSAGFIAKVRADGTGLVYCGYIAGTTCRGIALDGFGNAYVTGSAGRLEDGFPAVVGPDLTFNGESEAFVAKVTAAGTGLAYCGYVGGAGGDIGNAIAVDVAGSAYITGVTESNETTFPVVGGPDLTFNTEDDAFVAKVDPSGASLAYCGYIGCNGRDYGHGIAVDGAGCAYVVGSTFRFEDELGQPRPPLFPLAVGPDLTFNGYMDAFVCKLDATGTSFFYSGYIGGQYLDCAYGVAVDAAGNAYVAGETGSSQATFPVAVGPDVTFNERSEAFVSKVNPTGEALAYSGYIGGSGDDYAYAIAVDAAGSAYVTGETWSDQVLFPAVNGPDRNANSLIDAFVTKVNPSGSALVYSGFIGGGDNDFGYGIAVDATGCAYITGSTGSSNLPVNVGPGLTGHIGSTEVLVAKVPAAPVVYTPAITALEPPSAVTMGPAFTLTIRGTDFSRGATMNWNYEGLWPTFISETELQVEIPQYYIWSGGLVPIRVWNPGGEVSADAIFAVNNPVPTIDSFDPAYITGGVEEAGIFPKGTGWVEGSVAHWNGQEIYSGLSWTGEGWAIVPGSALTEAGNATVTVFNPPPAGGTSNAVIVPVTGYQLGVSPPSVTVTAGQQAVYTITASPLLGPFDGRIDFSCADLPRGCTKSFYPMGLTPGPNPGVTTLTLSTLAGASAVAAAAGPIGPAPRGPLLPGLLFLLPGLWPRLRMRLGSVAARPREWALTGAAAVLLVLFSSCGSSGQDTSQGTPKGTYHIRVDAVSGTMTESATLTLVVR